MSPTWSGSVDGAMQMGWISAFIEIKSKVLNYNQRDDAGNELNSYG
jgi:hypothetical protein